MFEVGVALKKHGTSMNVLCGTVVYVLPTHYIHNMLV